MCESKIFVRGFACPRVAEGGVNVVRLRDLLWFPDTEDTFGAGPPEQPPPWSHLGLLKVQVLADGGEQPAEAFQRLFVVVLQQLDHTVVHDGLRQHLQLEQLADELDVADGPPAGFVLGFFQLLLEPLALRRLKDKNIGGWILRDAVGALREVKTPLTDAAESSSFCFLSNTTSSTLSFSNSFWQRFSSSLRKFTVELGLSVICTFSWKRT